MKLISMTDFVLEQNNKMFVLTSDRTYTFQEYGQVVISYARFLKKPLTLGMFVSCDEDGNPFKVESDGLISNCQCDTPTKCNDFCKKYEEAKEKVLFEGIALGRRKSNKMFWCLQPYDDFYYDPEKKELRHYKCETVEDMARYYCDGEISLSKSAQKQIGL